MWHLHRDSQRICCQKCSADNDVQVADTLCLLEKPDEAEACMASDNGILNGELCSGNGIFSQSPGVCICNAGWQVCVCFMPLPAG